MKNKKIKLIAFDMDGTLVHYKNEFQSSWSALLEGFGFGQIVEENEKKYYNKRSRDSWWTREEALMLEGKPVIDAISYLFPIPYAPGADDFLMKSKGEIIRGIITTGLDLIAEPIARGFDLEFVKYNTLIQDNGFFTGEIKYKVPLWGKANILKQVAQEFRVPLEEVCFVGDNDNDRPSFGIVGLPVAFDPKTKKTAKKAKYRIKNFKKLEKILFINSKVEKCIAILKKLRIK